MAIVLAFVSIRLQIRVQFETRIEMFIYLGHVCLFHRFSIHNIRSLKYYVFILIFLSVKRKMI